MHNIYIYSDFCCILVLVIYMYSTNKSKSCISWYDSSCENALCEMCKYLIANRETSSSIKVQKPEEWEPQSRLYQSYTIKYYSR